MWARTLGLSFAFAALSFIFLAFTAVAFNLVNFDSLNSLLTEIKSLEGFLTVISFCLLVSTTSIGYHRLVVMEKNLEETKSNNNFTNYFKHRELFFSLCESIEKKYDVRIESNELYKSIFPKSTKFHAIGEVNKNSLKGISFNSSNIQELISHEIETYQINPPFDDSKVLIDEKIGNSLNEIFTAYEECLKSFQISVTNNVIRVPVESNEQTMKIAQYRVISRNLRDSFKSAYQIHRQLAHFSDLEEPSFDESMLEDIIEIGKKYQVHYSQYNKPLN